MARVAVQFVASSNMTAVSADIAKINAQLAAMATQLKAVGASSPRMMKGVQQEFARGIGSLQGWESQAMSARTVTAKLTEDINRQRVAMRDYAKVRKNVGGIVEDQLRLRKSQALITGTDLNGRVKGELITPMNSYASAAERATMRTGVLGAALQSAGQDFVKTGKQMQWTGRQLSSGFTLPIVALAAGAGKAAYDIDAAMVRLEKVYGDLGGVTEEELKRVKENTMDTAKEMANAYGIAGKATVTLAADLAAAGYEGKELQETTKEIQRISLLGELDQDKAMDAARTIKNVFGVVDPAELAKKFNFLNAVENQTSTSLQDLTEVIPRTSSTIKELGGSLEDSALFTVAFKEAGIDAVRGANALRSSLGAIVAPSGVAQERLKGLGIDIRKIAKENHPDNGGGGIVSMLQALGTELEGLSGLQKSEALAILFGRYQFDKMAGLLKNLATNANDASTQTGRAVSLAAADATELAAVAEREIATIQESLSGRIKRAAQTIVITMAELGKPVLAFVAMALETISSLVSAINSLPKPLKAMGVTIAAIFAIGGPILYITGLFKAFSGSVIKTIGSLFKRKAAVGELTTAEKMFADIALQQTVPAMQAQTASMGLLTKQVESAVLAYQALIKSSTAAAGLNSATKVMPVAATTVAPSKRRRATSDAGPPGMPILNGSGIQKIDGRRGATKPAGNTAPAVVQAEKLADATTEAEKSSRRMAGHWTGVAQSMSLIAPMLVMMSGTTNPVLVVGSQLLLVLALIPKSFELIGKAAMAAAAKMKLVGIAGAAAPKISTAFKGASASVAGMLGPLAAVVAAIGIAIGVYRLWQRSLENTRKKQEGVNDSAKTMAETIGFKHNVQGEKGGIVDPKTGEAIDTIIDKTKKWKEANADAAKGLEEMSDEKLIREAMEIGIDARKSGANAAQAMQAVEIALRAARGDLADALLLKIDVEVGNMDDIMKLQDELQRQKLTDTLTNSGYDTGFMENISRTLFYKNDEMNEAAKVAARGVGEAFGEGLVGDPQSIRDQFKRWRAMIDENTVKNFDQVKNLTKKQAGAIREAGINPDDEAAVLKYLRQFDSQNLAHYSDRVEVLDNDLQGLAGSLQRSAQQEYELTQGFLKSRGVPADVASEIRTLDRAYELLKLNVIDVKDANSGYHAEIEKSMQSNKGMTEVEQLAILNKWRMKAGLDNATTAAQGFGDAISGAGQEVGKTQVEMEKLAITADQFASSFRNNVSGNMSEAVGIMTKQYDEVTSELQSAIDTEAENWSERNTEDKRLSDLGFKDRSDKLNSSHKDEMQKLEDKQELAVQAIQAEIDKADDLDEKRERMFQAELTRMQRLSDAANRNIDFNIALKGGDLDEAARISEGAYTSLIENNIADAQDAISRASDARNAAGEAKISALEETFPGQKTALEERHKIQEAALEEDKRLADLRFEYDRKIYQKGIQERKKSLDTQRGLLRDTLARELEDRLKVIPATQPEYDKNFQWMKGKYRELTGNVLVETDRWISLHQSGFKTAFENTKTELADQAAWSAIGKQAVDGLTEGMLGMSFKDFAKWMETGELPAEPAPPPPTSGATPFQRGNTMPGGNTTAPKSTPTTHRQFSAFSHSGGPVSDQGSGRAGRPLNAPLYPDEVPTVLQKGEYVMDRDSVNRIGADNLAAMQRGQTSFYHSGGLVGAIGAKVMATFQQSMGAAIQAGANRKAATLANQGNYSAIPAALQSVASAAGGGKYGDAAFGDEQLRNAATIISVGRSMGATDRDLVIAIMTALQESTLRNINYGDRDSVGLFQQRTSQGWGSIEQIMDPRYSSRKFFEALMKVGSRDKLSLSAAAQAVQRSAFPSAYAKWQNEAEAILAATGAGGIGGAGGPQYQGGGTFSAFGGTVTGDIKGLQMEFLNRLARWSGAVGSPYKVGSGYRSMAEQAYLYNRYMAGTPGQAPAAPPGRSNHNFGLASDGPHWRSKNPGAFGLTYPMSYEPWHVEPIGARGMRIPQLQVGGTVRYDDTIANLHKNETVLTAPLSQKLEQGINKLDSGGTTQYNININGANASADEIVSKVMTAIQRKEQIRGPKRVIGNG